MDTPSSTSPNTGSTASSTNGAAGNPQKIVERVAQTAHDTVDRVAAAAGPALERLSTGYSSAGDTLRAKADQFGQLEEQWIASARGYVRDHPLAAVGIGLLAGWIIGRLGSSD
jgi:ElaB/YqjD/DUF883 family membrane-anchored ribosome-binding protein